MAEKLVIKLNGQGYGTVELDGTDISRAVRAVKFGAGAGQSLEVTIELTVMEIETICIGSDEAEVLISLDDDTINTLLALGWVPPADDRRTYRTPVTRWIPADEFEALTPRAAEARVLPTGCRCFDLNHHMQYFGTGIHHERCPLFITDNQSPDAND